VVFWDSLVVQYAFGRSHEAVRDYLRDRGYEVMGVQALRAWMQSRVADRAPSVVVFALDHASSLVASPAPDGRLMRRYLDGSARG
jgi:AmiR/NasT family two-component response regulator